MDQSIHELELDILDFQNFLFIVVLGQQFSIFLVSSVLYILKNNWELQRVFVYVSYIYPYLY